MGSFVFGTHALDYSGDGVFCIRCGATDIDAAADPECGGEDRWGVWCSHPKSPGWCVRDNRGEWNGARADAEREAIKWRTMMADEAHYSVRRYPLPAPAATTVTVEAEWRDAQGNVHRGPIGSLREAMRPEPGKAATRTPEAPHWGVTLRFDGEPGPAAPGRAELTGDWWRRG